LKNAKEENLLAEKMTAEMKLKMVQITEENTKIIQEKEENTKIIQEKEEIIAS
jgi:hypothetical protein